VANPDLLVTVYGPVAPDLNSANGEPHVWTGMCKPACGVTLKIKNSYADLSGKAHITWKSRTSGFHQIRPMVKLADGTTLVGNFADENDYDYRLVDFHLATVRWLVLDTATLTTKGTLLPTVDLGQSNYVISFGADFLGTWNSPVAQAIGYGRMRNGRHGQRG